MAKRREMKTIDHSDVQRVVARGYNFDYAKHIILKVRSPARAREFLKNLQSDDGPGVTDSMPLSRGPSNPDWAKMTPVNIAFTYGGLKALELDANVLNIFNKLAPAFVAGASVRAHKLGDFGASASAQWEKAFKFQRAHVLISVFANSIESIDVQISVLRKLRGARGLSGWQNSITGAHIGTDKKDRREHFGFRDGISQPSIRGFTQGVRGRTSPSMRTETGEILLGYKNETGANRWSTRSLSKELSEFFFNGCFAAFRKVEQDVQLFNSVANENALALNNQSSNSSVDGEFFKAKMVGRWPNGSLIQPGEKVSPQSLSENVNNFDYSHDPKGEGCPFNSHIRRVNPRADDVLPPRKRPLLRRGIPYGPKYIGGENGSEERGLVGMFFCASLEDQFEFLMNDWVNKPPLGPDKDTDAKDPLIGNHQRSTTRFSIPQSGTDKLEVTGLQPFTTTKGMLYAFYPSLTALNMIANQKS